MRATAIRTLLLFVAGLVFVHSGAASWLWERVERDDVKWRTGPTWTGALGYLTIYWGGWAVLLAGPRLVSPRAGGGKGSISFAAAFEAVRLLISSCLLVAVQVLMPATWLLAALSILLVATLVDAYLIREAIRRAITNWAWGGAGVALATLLIHPYFVGSPLFVVRLAVLMTLWEGLGRRMGVSPRLSRFVPSLRGDDAVYDAASDCTAAHARVAR